MQKTQFSLRTYLLAWHGIKAKSILAPLCSCNFLMPYFGSFRICHFCQFIYVLHEFCNVGRNAQSSWVRKSWCSNLVIVVFLRWIDTRTGWCAASKHCVVLGLYITSVTVVQRKSGKPEVCFVKWHRWLYYICVAYFYNLFFPVVMMVVDTHFFSSRLLWRKHFVKYCNKH